MFENNYIKLIDEYLLIYLNKLPKLFYDETVTDTPFRWYVFIPYLFFLIIYYYFFRVNIYSATTNTTIKRLSIRHDIYWFIFAMAGKLTNYLFIFPLEIIFYTIGFDKLIIFLNLSNKINLNLGEKNNLTVLFLIIFIFMIYDFAMYYIHYLFHKSKILWQFHKIHHISPQINLFTNYRTHPVETFLIHRFQLIVISILLAILSIDKSLYDDRYLLIKELSPLIYIYIAFAFFISKFHHSGLPLFLNSKWNFINTPGDHLIHHSRTVRNKNFAHTFIIWDKLFGTYYAIKNHDDYIIHLNDIGVDNELYKNNNFIQILFSPFINIFHLIFRRKSIYPRAIGSGEPFHGAKNPRQE